MVQRASPVTLQFVRWGLVLSASLIAIGVGSGNAVYAQRPLVASEALPPDTAAFVSIPDLQMLIERFDATELGALARDPQAEAFFDDLKGQLELRIAGRLGRRGLTIEDLKGVRTGEIGYATLVTEGRPSSILLVDVVGHEEAVRTLLDRITANLKDQKADEEPAKTMHGATVRSFLMPPKAGEIRRPRVQFTEHAGWIVISSELAGMDQVLRRFVPNSGLPHLGIHPAFVRIVERLSDGRGDDDPQVAWYVDPFGLAAAIKAEQPVPAPSFKYIDAMAASGFSAISAVGGDLRFDRDEWDVDFQTFAVVPGSEGLDTTLMDSARMLPRLPAASDRPVVPSRHVGASTATMLAGNWEFGDAFGAAESLIDKIHEPGVFARIVNDLRMDPNIQVDLRQLARELGPGFTFSTEIVPPFSDDCEKILLSVQVLHPDQIVANLENYLKADGYEPIDMGTGVRAWQYVPVEVVAGDIDVILNQQVGQPPANGEQPPLMQAFAMVDNELLASNDLEYLRQVLARSSDEELTKDTAYRRVAELVRSRSPGTPTMLRFGRPDRIYRLTYELMQAGELTTSDTFVERLLRMLDGTEKGVMRRSQIDAVKLPMDFNTTVAPRLLPTGWSMTVEKDGWYIVGGILAPPTH